MENLGLYVLNGRTNGDIPGRYSFMNKIGNSTIDLTWANLEFIEQASEFNVTTTLSFSNNSIGSIVIGTNEMNSLAINSLGYHTILIYKPITCAAYNYYLDNLPIAANVLRM